MTDELILLDTTVIVDYLRGDNKVVIFLKSLANSPIISLITEAEIYQGAKNSSELIKWEKFFSKFKVLPITPEISHLAITQLKQFRLSHGLNILDAFIAATAIENKYILLTSNVKHFHMIKALKFKPWPLR